MDFNYYYKIYSSFGEQYFSTFQIIDAILFVLFSLSVIYLLVFLISTKLNKRKEYPQVEVQANFVVVIPLYGDNKLIFNSIDSVIKQNYKNNVSVIIVANDCTNDFMSKITYNCVTVITKKKQRESNLLSGDYLEALEFCETNKIKCDIISILQCGDILEQDSLIKINDAYYSGCDVIQIRRHFSDKVNTTAILEAVGEEINNTIFREGHTALGFSSAIMDSGISFNFKTFCEIRDEISDPHPEKQIETALLKRNIYIEYLNYAYICRLKKIDSSTYYKYKRSSHSIQRNNLFKTIFSFPKYFFNHKLDYCNKIIQWVIPSRIIISIMMMFIMLLVVLINWSLGIKWLVLIIILTMLYISSIPNYLINKKLRTIIILAPFYFTKTIFKMIFNKR